MGEEDPSWPELGEGCLRNPRLALSARDHTSEAQPVSPFRCIRPKRWEKEGWAGAELAAGVGRTGQGCMHCSELPSSSSALAALLRDHGC